MEKEIIDIEVKILDLEIKIVELREEGYTYGGIQLRLGNPSKKYIRSVLTKHAPHLVGDVLTNRGKLQKQ